MPETRTPHDVIELAEQAAAAGDFAAAASLLREAAALQEAQLGPWHPDLASTLNNLGVASESIGQTEQAESSYRRAVDIATRMLPADDPIVTQSARNLQDFCQARGIPVVRPAPAPVPLTPTPGGSAPGAAPATRAVRDAPPPPAGRNERQPSTVDVPRLQLHEPPIAGSSGIGPPVAGPRPVIGSGSRMLMLAVLLGIVLVSILMVVGRSWLTGGAADSPPEGTAPLAAASDSPSTPAPVADAASPAPPVPPASEPPAPRATPDTAPASPTTSVPEGVTPETSATTPARSMDLRVSDARLCRNLTGGSGRYDCEPAASPVRAGRLTFLTRINADRNTTVQHRWYRGGRLQQIITLRVTARPDGFTTYSRVTVWADPGDWKVALTTTDGTVLREEAFDVR